MTLSQASAVLKSMKVGKTSKGNDRIQALTTVRVRDGRMYFDAVSPSWGIKGSIAMPDSLRTASFQVEVEKLLKALDKFGEPEGNLGLNSMIFPSGKSGEFKLKISEVSVEENQPSPNAFTASAMFPEFLKAMSFVRKSVSTEGIRQYLNGVSIEFADSLAVTIDGRRLSVHPLNFSGNIEKAVTIPAIIVDTLSKLDGQFVTISTSNELGGDVRLTVDNTVEFFWRHESTFPNFKQVVPKSSDFTVVLDAETVEEIGQQCKTVESMHKATVFPALSPTFTDKGIEFHAPNLVEEWGDYRFEVKPVSSENAGMLDGLSINAGFLRDALSNLPGVVTIEGKTFNCPIKFTSPATEGYHVVMPMKRITA